MQMIKYIYSFAAINYYYIYLIKKEKFVKCFILNTYDSVRLSSLFKIEIHKVG